MNAKLVSLAITVARFGSSALTGQPSGRDSVYAQRGSTSTKPVGAVNGSGGDYGTGLPPLTLEGNLKTEA